MTTKKGTGKFLLYHGNLAVGENNEAAIYLIKNVFSELKLPAVIAGNDPSQELIELAAKYDFIKLKDQITTEEINHFIADAQVNLLHTNQATGIKLKLINALSMGRHCVANKKMTKDTGLEGLCHDVNSAKEYVRTIKQLWDQEMTSKELAERERILLETYNNERSAAMLLNAIGFEELVQEKFSHLFA